MSNEPFLLNDCHRSRHTTPYRGWLIYAGIQKLILLTYHDARAKWRVELLWATLRFSLYRASNGVPSLVICVLFVLQLTWDYLALSLVCAVFVDVSWSVGSIQKHLASGLSPFSYHGMEQSENSRHWPFELFMPAPVWLSRICSMSCSYVHMFV